MTDEQPMSRRAAREAEAAAAKRPARSRRPARGEQPAAAAVGAESAGGGSGDGPPPEKPARGGIGAVFAKHPTAWLTGALAVVFVLLGTGAVFAGVSVGSAAAPAPTPTETVDPRPLPIADVSASRIRTCSIAVPASDARLMSFSGQVVRADTAEVLFDRAGDTPARTASVLKVLTAAAALEVLGPDYRIRTSVVSGGAPGSIVLVGRGDATLSQLPPGAESVYRGAPKLSDLAAQVLANYSGEEPISSIVLDASYWPVADKWHPSWARSEQTQGYHSEVTALQVDGDRADPTRQTSPRSTDPVGRAGELFLQALRAADTEDEVAEDVSITTGTAAGGASVLGEVASQPVSSLIPYMLLVSDNTLAEMLARITSKESFLNGSAASLQQAIPSALNAGFGIIDGTMVIKDGSGLSHENAVSPASVDKLLLAMVGGAPNLDIVRSGLPVAGQSGTLSSRFTGGNAVARGAVAAKTGWITTAYTLAGTIQAADGTPFVFTFYAIGDGISGDAREALDTVATAVFNCGDNLSNN